MASKDTVVTIDHEYFVLGGMMKNAYAVAIVAHEINDSYFSDACCKIIYKSLSTHYEKYQKLPTLQELSLAVESNYIDLGTPLDKVKSSLIDLYGMADIDEEFLFDKTVELIKKVRVNRSLSKALELIKSGNAMDNEQIATELMHSLEINLKKSNILCLGDTSGLRDARKQAVGDNQNKSIIRSILGSVNQSLQYRGYQKGTLNLVVSPPGTGKTSYLINEGSYAAMQGFTVLHVFLGDMIHYDGFIRYAACISGRLQDDIVAMTSDDQDALVASCNLQYPGILNKIQILAYGAGEISVEVMLENIKQIQDKVGIRFDEVIIDYADNLAKDMTQMYTEGGMIYDRLALFGRVNNSVMLVASQPKISYWNTEIIPLEGAAESSRKQHIVDLMLTFNLVARDATIGTIFMPKVRRGTSGRLVRVQTAWECCRIQEITEDEYVAKKGQLGLN